MSEDDWVIVGRKIGQKIVQLDYIIPLYQGIDHHPKALEKYEKMKRVNGLDDCYGLEYSHALIMKSCNYLLNILIKFELLNWQTQTVDYGV